MRRTNLPPPVAAVYDRRGEQKRVAHSFGGHRPPLQKTQSLAFLLCCFLLAVAPVAYAQTNTAPDPAQVAPVAPDPNAPSVQVTPTTPGQSASQEDISDIRPPFFFLHSWFFLWLALAAAALVALCILVWKWLSKPAYLSPKSAYDLTLEKLEKARELLREEDPVPYAIFVSETIRNYLGQRFQAPSTRRTTEEFLRMMEADPNTPLAEHRDLLRNFLQATDLVKFAKYQPTQAELEEVQQRAFTFVHATKPAPAPGRNA